MKKKLFFNSVQTLVQELQTWILKNFNARKSFIIFGNFLPNGHYIANTVQSPEAIPFCHNSVLAPSRPINFCSFWPLRSQLATALIDSKQANTCTLIYRWRSRAVTASWPRKGPVDTMTSSQHGTRDWGKDWTHRLQRMRTAGFFQTNGKLQWSPAVPDMELVIPDKWEN